MPEEGKILINRAKCDLCGDIITSRFRHDFRSCKCENINVDGGLSYIKRGGKLEWYEELTVYDDGTHATRREYVEWGSRGPLGDQPLKYAKVKDLKDDHIDAIIEWHEERGRISPSNFYINVIIDEKEYRECLK